LSKKILILDSSAILGGLKLHLIEDLQVIPSGIMDEIKNQESRENLNLAFKHGNIQIREPSEEAIEEVHKIALESGDSFVLSNVDISVVALGLDIKLEGNDPVILTDDYSIQNIAAKMNITYDKVMEKGIKKQISWKIVCPGCEKEYSSNKKETKCEVCGTKLKRIAIK